MMDVDLLVQTLGRDGLVAVAALLAIAGTICTLILALGAYHLASLWSEERREIAELADVHGRAARLEAKDRLFRELLDAGQSPDDVAEWLGVHDRMLEG